MLLEENPELVAIDLAGAGKSSDYRGPDFRKPFIRFNQASPGHHGHLNDFPVFNGPYSTACYLEATVSALGNLFEKADRRPSAWLKELAAIFMHRPYQRMPESGLALGYLFSLSRGAGAEHDELAEYCAVAGESVDAVVEELNSRPSIGEAVDDQMTLALEAYPRSMNVVRSLRNEPAYRAVVTDKLAFGADLVSELGNLYTASLPAWLAAGFEDAANRGADLAGREVLLIGYGSGDAAEAIPCTVMPGWEAAAKRIGMREALEDQVPLNREQYERLHAGEHLEIHRTLRSEFVVSHVGGRQGPLVDEGIEYYRFVS
jgi:hydroxymethylglutaryl-CoA synthase